MSYGITQSYLPPDRGSVSRPYPGRIGRYSIYPPNISGTVSVLQYCVPLLFLVTAFWHPRQILLCHSKCDGFDLNGAQCCEQFLQVGRLDRALILLYLPSASVSSVFMVIFIYIF